ncbi:hypothetical protein M5G07_13020 [Serratia symbiotica]|nr:hypothetical protein [Serratia symbiotica]
MIRGAYLVQGHLSYFAIVDIKLVEELAAQMRSTGRLLNVQLGEQCLVPGVIVDNQCPLPALKHGTAENIYPGAMINGLLPVQCQMVAELGNHHLS